MNAILLTQGGATTFLQNPISRVKATNAIADSAAGYNFRADGAPILLNVPFAASSTYINIASGNHTLQLEASNVPGTIAASLTKSLDGAHDYSLVAIGTSAAPQLTAITDDNSSPPVGLAKLRFINAMSGSSAVDVQVNFAGELSGLAFGTPLRTTTWRRASRIRSRSRRRAASVGDRNAGRDRQRRCIPRICWARAAPWTRGADR